jgi:hypothetical protein
MSEPETHDYTEGTWGHDYTIRAVIDGGRRLLLTGWGEGVRRGDFILLDNKGRSTRYRIDAIEYDRDPPDMWKATVSFAPRQTP